MQYVKICVSTKVEDLFRVITRFLKIQFDKKVLKQFDKQEKV